MPETLDIPKVTSRTTMTLFTGQVVAVKEVCYALGKTPDGIVYRVVYFTDDARELKPRGCKARYLDGEWEEFTGSLRTVIPAREVPERNADPIADPYGGTIGERFVSVKLDRSDDSKFA